MSSKIAPVHLKEIVTRWGPTEEANINALGDGWHIAERFADLHASALEQVSVAAGSKPSKAEKAVIEIGCHGLNLFIGIVSLILRGQFDVVSHLMRAHLDAQSLLYAALSRPDRGERFLDGELRASDARRLLIEDLRPADATLAERISARFLDDYGAANDLSHVSAVHSNKILQLNGTSVTPYLGGHHDPNQARAMMKAALEHEQWELTWFHGLRGSTLSSAWADEFEATKEPFSRWMKAD